MVQRFRVCVAMQQTLVQSLVRKILHATEQLNLCATTTELLQPTAHTPQRQKLPQGKTCALRLESSPHSL